jgi:hypothetical protein
LAAPRAAAGSACRRRTPRRRRDLLETVKLGTLEAILTGGLYADID